MFLRIGHKGADAIAPGNTLESFAAAVEAGVDAIELDVLRPRSDFATPTTGTRPPPARRRRREPLLIAHDWGDAARREPLTLAEGLDAFTRPPLDEVRFNLDLKVAGREDEVVAAVREHGLIERAMTSTMEVRSVEYLRDHAPELARGWTLPQGAAATTRAARCMRPIYPRRLRLPARPPAGDRPPPRAAARRLGDLGLPPADHAPARRTRRTPSTCR